MPQIRDIVIGFQCLTNDYDNLANTMSDRPVEAKEVDHSLLNWARENLAGILDDDNYAKMISGVRYDPFVVEYEEARLKSNDIAYEYFNTLLSNFSSPDELLEHRNKLIQKLLGKSGKDTRIEAPFHINYGFNMSVGENFLVKPSSYFEDDSIIRIGNNVSIGPKAKITTVTRLLGPDGEHIVYAHPITIGNNVWIGASCTIQGGVTIGDNVVVVSGTSITKDVPANTVVGK